MINNLLFPGMIDYKAKYLWHLCDVEAFYISEKKTSQKHSKCITEHTVFYRER